MRILIDKMKYALIKEGYIFIKKILKHNASINTDEDIMKMQYTILRQNHVIEKGMSMRFPRKGFGQDKVLFLICRLSKYYDLYGKRDLFFLIYPLSTILEYIKYTKNNDVDIFSIEAEFKRLYEKTGFTISDLEANEGGIKLISRIDILNSVQNLDFKSFVQSRHSIRYFSPELPDYKLIEKALEIAQYTPSACNRQGWMAHIFMGAKNRDLLGWQGGANGFYEEIPMSILVTANMSAFLSYEPNQVYVDGGLYAMSLLYAIHSQGLGTISLSCGFYSSKLSALYERFDIPDNEVPIMIIGVGCLLENFNIAISKRKDISRTTVIHK